MGMTDIEKRALKGGGSATAPIAVRLPEATRISGLSRSDIYRRAARGELVLLKAGAATLVDYDSLLAVVMSLPRALIRVASPRLPGGAVFQSATRPPPPQGPRARAYQSQPQVKETD